MKQMFTFGMGQELEGYGSLRNHYVMIEGETTEHCRATMLNHFKQVWSHQYDEEKAIGLIKIFNMIELPREVWPPDSGLYGVSEANGAVWRK